MCTGSIDPQLVFEAFENGIDGVIIMGCHFGDCHYLTGNYNAEKKVKMVKLLLAKTEIEPERFHLEWVSAAEGPKFAEVVKGFTEKIASLGPNPLFENGKTDSVRLKKLLGAKHASEAFKLRAVVGRERKLTEEGNVYGDKVPFDEYQSWMTDFVDEQYIRSRILDAVRVEPKTVQQLAADLNLPTKVVFVHVGRLWKKQMILPVGHTGVSPTYSIAEGV
jgi:coenzyme F420-reducing hydrogenase delta subunit